MTHFPRLLTPVLLACLWLAAAPSRADTITVGGTGAALGTMRMLAAQFARQPAGDIVTVVPNLGTGGGIKAVAAGKLDMAAIARPLKPQETALGLVAVEYGRTPFVIATSKSQAGTVRNLSELADIYSGRRANWSGGAPIRLVMRPLEDSDMQLLGSMSADLQAAIPVALARPGMIVASTDQEAADGIEQTPGAIGTSSLSVIRTEKRQVNLMQMGGVVPSAKSAADGSYPYVKVMYLARSGAGSPAVGRFMEFVASPQGRRILDDAGHAVQPAR